MARYTDNLEDVISSLVKDSLAEAIEEFKAPVASPDKERGVMDLVVADPVSAPVVAQAQALQSLAKSMEVVSTFVSQGGLSSLLQGYAKTNSVSSLLNGLTANAGRGGLDARFMEQNAVEITHLIEAVFDKYEKHLSEKAERDPQIHDAEKDFKRAFAKDE